MNTLTVYCQRATLALLLLFTSNQAFSSAATAENYQQALSAWAAVLSSHVDSQGRINFAAVAANPKPLQRYVDFVAGYGVDSHPEDFQTPQAVLAYHINTYNALAMWGVLERGIPKGFSSFFSRASFFKFRAIKIDGKKTNLYDYENKVIRPLGEPLAHFALNCMVRDCPRLLQQPFDALTLDAQLESAAVEFFQQPNKLQLDHAKQRINVSSILKFYTEDFVASNKASDLPGYINRYVSEPLPSGYQVKFIDYDWRINKQPE